MCSLVALSCSLHGGEMLSAQMCGLHAFYQPVSAFLGVDLRIKKLKIKLKQNSSTNRTSEKSRWTQWNTMQLCKSNSNCSLSLLPLKVPCSVCTPEWITVLHGDIQEQLHWNKMNLDRRIKVNIISSHIQWQYWTPTVPFTPSKRKRVERQKSSWSEVWVCEVYMRVSGEFKLWSTRCQ